MRLRTSSLFGSLPTKCLGFAGVLAIALAGCGSSEVVPLPRWTFTPDLIFPADSGLARPEDGVALPDGRLIVADETHGLRALFPGGTHRPFGTLAAAGYSPSSGAANGVSLDPDGQHLLVSDVVGGGIYRVHVNSGETTLIYRHRFGVNTVRRDHSGTVWFTQSTENSPEQGLGRLFAAVDKPVADGALLRLPFRNGQFAADAEVVVTGLYFPNGLALDEERGQLYLSETTGGRVLRFRFSSVGPIGEPVTAAEIPVPDNVELDRFGRLWIAVPLRSEVIVYDPATGVSQSVFRAQNAEQEAIAADFIRRGEVGQSRLELITPALWSPLPGMITGVILTPGDGPVYLTGLGNALIRLPR